MTIFFSGCLKLVTKKNPEIYRCLRMLFSLRQMTRLTFPQIEGFLAFRGGGKIA